jgi:hypothetical protein
MVVMHEASGATPGRSRKAAQGAQPTSLQRAASAEAAAIIPVGQYTIGNSLAYSSAFDVNYGYGLFANGISGHFKAANPATYNFVIFVFPAKSSLSIASRGRVRSLGPGRLQSTGGGGWHGDRLDSVRHRSLAARRAVPARRV